MKTTRTSTRARWKDLLPKEHGAWAWLSLPLVFALTLAPTAATTAGALAAVAGFAGVNGAGRALRGALGARLPTTVALLVALALTVVSIVCAQRPTIVLVTLGGGGVAGLMTMALVGGRVPRTVAAELAAIGAFVALAAALAWASGAAMDAVFAGALAVGAWLVLGLWYVKGALARVLARREPWHAGRYVASAVAVASLVVGGALGHALVGALPLAYVVRIAAHRPPRTGHDARRVGLTELAWGVVVALAAGLLAGLAA